MEDKIYTVISESFRVKNNDNKSISGHIFRPEDKNEVFPAVIFSHGFGANYRELMHHGRGFAEKGIVCIFFDFCGGGLQSESDGNMTEMTIETEVNDLITVMNHVLSISYIDKSRLYLMGESMGGLVSAIVARRYKSKVKGLVLWYPAFCIPEDAKRRLSEGITDFYGTEISTEFDEVAGNIDITDIQSGYDRPVLLIHGDEDELVPIEYSRKAKEVYEFSTLHEISGGGHGFEGKDSENARNISIEFILLNEK